ncbi:MAG TPA: hypothetical protein VKV80_07850 [Streptosporangiaceae bacterium]|nr:hypothetical protein [Streptosporangiaceae bacterium]
MDHLVAERAVGRGRVVDADHREEHLIGDADREEQVGVDAGVGEFTEGGRPCPGLVVHPEGKCRAHRVLDAGALEHRLGSRLVVGDERHGAGLALGCRAQDEVDTAAGHRLTETGKLAGLVLQVHGEHAHPALLSPRCGAVLPLTLSVTRDKDR